jgi:hypothetical protein
VTGATRVPVPGQPVTLRTHTNPNQKWAPGQLVKVLGPRRVQIRTKDGVLVERHTDQVKLHPPAPPKNIPVIQTDLPSVPEARPVRNAGRPKRLQD